MAPTARDLAIVTLGFLVGLPLPYLMLPLGGADAAEIPLFGLLLAFLPVLAGLLFLAVGLQTGGDAWRATAQS